MANYDLNGRLKITVNEVGGPPPIPATTYPLMQGFKTTNLADVYRSNANGVLPGANNFVAVGLTFPFDNRDTGGYQLLVNNFFQSGAEIYGWGIYWSYGNITVGYIRNNGGTGFLEEASVAQSAWNDVHRKGTFQAVGIRLSGAGPSSAGTLEIWLGGAIFATSTAAGNGALRVNTGGPLNLGGGGLFFQELAMQGACCGLGYFEGTTTNDNMRGIMIDSLQIGRVPTGRLAWNVIANGSQMLTIPATFTSTVGSVLFDRIGSPTIMNLGGVTL